MSIETSTKEQPNTYVVGSRLSQAMQIASVLFELRRVGRN